MTQSLRDELGLLVEKRGRKTASTLHHKMDTSTPERKFLQTVMEWVRQMREAGMADGATLRLGVLAAEITEKSENLPPEEAAWQAFAEEHGITSAIKREAPTLVRAAAQNSMDQAMAVMKAKTARNPDVASGLHGASIMVRHRAKLDMDEVGHWIARDLSGLPLGGSLAPIDQRVDEGWDEDA